MRFPAAVALLVLAGNAHAQWETYSYGRVRADLVTDLPGGREVERGRLHGFFGVRNFFGNLEVGAALKTSLGTESNSVNVANLDNEEEDSLDLGEAYLRYTTDAMIIEAGRAPLPFTLSALTWDHDLRPAGVSYQYDWDLGNFRRLSLLAGYFAPLHIDESQSRLGGLQFRYDHLAGSPEGFWMAGGYFTFDDLEEIVQDGRSRTNRRVGGRLVSDFDLASLSLGYAWLAGGRPLSAQLSLVKNTGALDQAGDEGARLELQYGAVSDGPWELGVSAQRIQGDAIMAAFNEDDWWFPSRMRGMSLWYGHRLSEHFDLKVSAFRERRDDLDEHVKRLLIDLRWEY